MKAHWKNALRLLGLGLLAWIIATVDWTAALQTFRKLDPFYLAGYVLCFVAMLLLRTARLRFALARLNFSLSFRDCYVATLEPAFIGVVTPGRLGEFSRVGYIHAHGVAMPEAVSLVTVERVIDMCVLLTFGAGGILYIFAPAAYHPAAVAVVALGLLLGAALIRGYDFVLRQVQARLGWMLRWEPAALQRHRQSLASSLTRVMQQAALPVFLISLACLALNFAQIFFLAKAFGFRVDYLVVIFAYATATLVSLLPISVGGLGTREATYIIIMGRVGIIKEQALLFSLMDGVVLGIFGLFLMVLPIWVWRAGKR